MSFLDKTKNMWKDIDEENESLEYDGIIFIREKNVETLPISCPVCKTMLNTVEDIDSYKEVEACRDCHISYYYQNKDRWINGWRPNLTNSDIIINNNEVNKDD